MTGSTALCHLSLVLGGGKHRPLRLLEAALPDTTCLAASATAPEDAQHIPSEDEDEDTDYEGLDAMEDDYVDNENVEEVLAAGLEAVEEEEEGAGEVLAYALDFFEGVGLTPALFDSQYVVDSFVCTMAEFCRAHRAVTVGGSRRVERSAGVFFFARTRSSGRVHFLCASTPLSRDARRVAGIRRLDEMGRSRGAVRACVHRWEGEGVSCEKECSCR